MKKLLIVIMLSFFSLVPALAMSFEEAYSQADKTPMVTLIYAQWADNFQGYVTSFNTVKEQLSGSFNFVELDIASKDAKLFNSKYHIYPNLPYVLMFRDGGKVSRYVPRDCALDSACLISKLKSFIQ